LQAYKYSGDVYAVHPGDKPWISEMYGYAFGASKADLWHKWDTFSMIYPGYEPRGASKFLMIVLRNHKKWFLLHEFYLFKDIFEAIGIERLTICINQG
jgi:hypothetical protein